MDAENAMKKITRREFLRLLALGGGMTAAGQLLGACKPAATPDSPGTPTNSPFFPEGVNPPGADTPTATATITPTDTASPTETATPPPTETPVPEASYLAVARGGDDPEELVRRAVAAIGGIRRFVPPGAKVLIKPNVCVSNRRYDFAATTNPWVVGALVKLCREAEAGRILIYDFPFGGPAAEAFQVSGIAEQVLAAGGEVEYVQYDKFQPVEMTGNVALGYASIYSEVLSADVVIDVPIAKHHGGAGLTLAMKNLMGTIRDRPAICGTNTKHRKIAELAAYIHPDLTVIDAVRILLAGGPSGGSKGDVRKIDTVIASADIVAADAYAATLFADYAPAWFASYADPNHLGYVKYAAAMGLGRSDLASLDIEEIAVGA
jgi:uncharacterized protein (DUF362 family)